ncbi:hypothetical protein [Methylomonas sp. DH-1]|nr:hypothetical protein [Methylomonas sp. DH-1]
MADDNPSQNAAGLGKHRKWYVEHTLRNFSESIVGAISIALGE